MDFWTSSHLPTYFATTMIKVEMSVHSTPYLYVQPLCQRINAINIPSSINGNAGPIVCVDNQILIICHLRCIHVHHTNAICNISTT